MYPLFLSIILIGASISSSIASTSMGQQSIVSLKNNILITPLPIWVSDKEEPLQHLRKDTRKQGNRISIKTIPLNERMHNWSQHLFTQIYIDEFKNIDEAFSSWIKPYYLACEEDGLQYKNISTRNNDFKFIELFCQNTPKTALPGYGNGIGSIAIAGFAHKKGESVIVSYEWRGKRYDIKNRKTWPVSEEMFNDAFQQLVEGSYLTNKPIMDDNPKKEK